MISSLQNQNDGETAPYQHVKQLLSARYMNSRVYRDRVGRRLILRIDNSYLRIYR